jgi:outer membrane protein OmpA-like peptidoglycan-associated protein
MSFVSKTKLLVSLLAFPFAAVFGQKDAIYLVNPSFEDAPHAGEVGREIPGWYNCGHPNETPPDIQPGFFNVAEAARHGSTYLGLVVRDNETWESVGQRLSRPLELNQCYEFSLDLCRTETYVSKTKSGAMANFITPAKLIIWGGNGYCDKGEVLYETSIIHNTRWLTYNCRFNPKKGNWSFIMIEAYYKTPVLFPYNGHILVDNASPIKQISCGPEKMPDPKPVLTKKGGERTAPPPAKPTARPPLAESKPEVKPTEAAAAPKIERKTVKTGKIYRLEKVYFDANKYDVKPESEPELAQLLTFLRENADIAIEVGGHTNNQMWPNDAFAMELSTNRAKSVANWLVSKGIAASRVQYKGYGWTSPIQPNTTPEGRKRNQRVEVKILAFNG